MYFLFWVFYVYNMRRAFDCADCVVQFNTNSAQWGIYLKGHYSFSSIVGIDWPVCVSKGRNRPNNALKRVWHPKKSFLSKNWPFLGKIATFCTKSQKHLFVLANENLVFSGSKNSQTSIKCYFYIISIFRASLERELRPQKHIFFKK